MATAIKGLSNLTTKELDILFTSLAESYSPIEINEKVYIIPQAINSLSELCLLKTPPVSSTLK